MFYWADSLDQDAPDLCEPEGPRGPGVTLQQRDAVSCQVLQEQNLRWPRLRVQVTEVLMFGSYGAGDLDPKALNKLIGNQCLRPLYCTLGTGSCKP